MELNNKISASDIKTLMSIYWKLFNITFSLCDCEPCSNCSSRELCQAVKSVRKYLEKLEAEGYEI